MAVTFRNAEHDLEKPIALFPPPKSKKAIVTTSSIGERIATVASECFTPVVSPPTKLRANAHFTKSAFKPYAGSDKDGAENLEPESSDDDDDRGVDCSEKPTAAELSPRRFLAQKLLNSDKTSPDNKV